MFNEGAYRDLGGRNEASVLQRCECGKQVFTVIYHSMTYVTRLMCVTSDAYEPYANNRTS